MNHRCDISMNGWSALATSVATIRNLILYAALGPIVVALAISAYDFTAFRHYLLHAPHQSIESWCLACAAGAVMIGIVLDMLTSVCNLRSMPPARLGTTILRSDDSTLPASEYWIRELWKRDGLPTFAKRCLIVDLKSDINKKANSQGSDLLDYRVIKQMNWPEKMLKPTQFERDARAMAAHRIDGLKSDIKGIEVNIITLDNDRCRAEIVFEVDGDRRIITSSSGPSPAIAITTAILEREILAYKS